MFKPNISPTVLDQNPYPVKHVAVLKSGEKVIIDPEATSDKIMLWFYGMVNVGACLGIATTYLAKYVGYYAAYLIPTVLYLLCIPLLWFAYPKLKFVPPGGSDLGKCFKVLGVALKKGGVKKVFRHGFWDTAKPSVLAAKGDTKVYGWDDQFVEDVRRTFQACGIFLFFPIANINDGGLGAATNSLSGALTNNGVPNDLIDNLNSVVIVVAIPIMNYVVYPLLRRFKIRWGPISRITFGFMLATIGSIPYSIIQHKIYQTSPCGTSASDCDIGDGVSPISLWIYAIPTGITALSEVFTNVTAFGIAYTRSPKNMKGLVMALNLFTTAISAAVGLGCSAVIRDPLLVWVFGAPTIIGFVLAVAFYIIYRDLDKEEFIINAFDDSPPLTTQEQRQAALAQGEITTHSGHSSDEKNDYKV
jgi:dipeptide/tripeptide permease